MATRRIQYNSGVQRLVRELKDILTGDEGRAWVVPIEEKHSALVVGNVNRAEYLRYVTNKTLDDAVALEVVCQDSEVSYTPPLIIPDRVVSRSFGTRYQDTPLMAYAGYMLSWPTVRTFFTYELDMCQLGEDLTKFRTMRGWSLTQAGQRMGMTGKAVLGVECGSMPTGQNLLRVLTLMGVQDYAEYLRPGEEKEWR